MTDAELLMLLEKARANIEEMLKGGGQGLTDTMEGILTSETEPEDDVSHDPDTTTLDPALPTSLSSGGSIHISTSATSLDHKPSSAIERQTSSPFPITSGEHYSVHLQPLFCFALQLKRIVFVARLTQSPLSLNVDGC